MKNLVIDNRVIKSNLQAVKERADGATIYADLSGDAYGMGLLETARLLRDEGIRDFIVADPRDAAALRSSGLEDERIMVLRSTADSKELEELIDLNVICTVGSYDAAVALNGIAEARKTVCEIQVEIDTGLGRYGFMPAETDKIAAIYRYMPSLAVIGLFTTFSAPWKSTKITVAQLDSFNATADRLIEMGYDVGVMHACDSEALFKYDFGRMDAVRAGTALSGRMVGRTAPGLHRVGYIEAGLEEVGWFPAGHRVGGSTVLKKPAKLAVLSVGYYHGFGVSRQEENASIFSLLFRRRVRRYVKLGGQKVRVVGAIGMMHTIIDVTKVDCTVGDVAILDVDPVNVKGLARIHRSS
jgi:alanine racemase